MFGEILKNLRKEKGISQEQLANTLDLKRSTVAMYESNKRKPSFELLEAIADLFNVDIDYLLGKSEIRNRYRYDKQMGVTMYSNDWSDNIKQIISLMSELNDAGQEKTVSYAEDLSQMEKYRK